MSTTDDSNSMEAGFSTEAREGTSTSPPDPQPVNGPDLTGNGPFPATVEDCPEEDGVALGTPTGPTPPLVFSPPITPDAPGESHGPQVTGQDSSPTPTTPQDNPFPPFIQLNKPAHQGSPQQAPPQQLHPQQLPSQSAPSQPAPPQRVSPRQIPSQQSSSQQGSSQPEALRYLDPDSPALTPETLRRSINNTTNGDRGPHPTSPSTQSHSSVPSSYHSDVFSQSGRNGHTEHSWSPQASTVSKEPFPNGAGYQGQNPHAGFPQQGPGWNGSSQMAFGPPQHTPFQGHAVPVLPSPYYGPGAQPATPMPFQKPPLTGYQHLSQKLAGALYGFPNITPLYRKFEALNHRLLLQLQDELAVLEEELEVLDNADTNYRAGPMGVMPASRRDENMAQSELSWKKQEILGNIGWKLSQYNKIISSFKETQYLCRPSDQEIEDYKGLLAHGKIIAEPETRFLNQTGDLVSLAVNDFGESVHDGQQHNGVAGDSTPTPQSSAVIQPPVLNKATLADEDTATRPTSPIYLAYAMILAVIIPTLTFLVVPGFLERMVIVALVFLGISGAVLQSGLLRGYGDDRGIADCIVCIGLYGGLMSVVASTFV